MRRRALRSYLSIGIAVLFVLTLFGYTFFRTENLIVGPQIVIESPTNGSTLSDPYVEIRGHAHNVSYLSLNGAQIFTDESGAFSEKLLAPYGYTIMTLKARDRYGRTVTKTLELVYQ